MSLQKCIEDESRENNTNEIKKSMEDYDYLSVKEETNNYLQKYLKCFTTMNIFESQWRCLKKIC